MKTVMVKWSRDSETGTAVGISAQVGKPELELMNCQKLSITIPGEVSHLGPP